MRISTVPTLIVSPESQKVKTGDSVWIKIILTNISSQGIDTSASISDLTGIDRMRQSNSTVDRA